MVRVKICGVTSVAQAVEVASLGADALGFNFIAESPRCVSFDLARAMIGELPPFAAPVGLFSGDDWLKLGPLSDWLGLRAVQPYGARWTRGDFRPFAWLMPFRVGDRDDVGAALAAAESLRPSAILIDAVSPGGALGGTGHRVPVELLEGVAWPVPMILAGGLNPGNVAEAVRRVRPWGVDVASGVERSPGVKDPTKVRDFLAAVHDAGRAS